MTSKFKSFHKDRVIVKKTNMEGHLRLWNRRTVITKELIDKIVEIHNGRQFIKIKINSSMVGHRLGEFAFTRRIYQYKKGKRR